MTDQQLKALKIHFTMLKASSEIANISNTEGVLFAFYNKLITKCDAMLFKLNSNTFSRNDIVGFTNWLEIEHAMLNDVDRQASFIQGGIISPTQTDGGEGVIVRHNRTDAAEIDGEILMQDLIRFGVTKHSNPKGIQAIISPRTGSTLVYIDSLDIYVPIQDFIKYADS
jgi:hypothetical protein